MREKVKIFVKGSEDEFEDLEKSINEWLREESVLKIISRTVSTSSGTDIHNFSFTVCTVCIFYEGGD